MGVDNCQTFSAELGKGYNLEIPPHRKKSKEKYKE